MPFWYERLFGKNLLKCQTISCGGGNVAGGDLIPSEILNKNHTIGVYFSFANMKTDDISKKLKELYGKLNEKEDSKKLEIIQVVLWANNDVYNDFEKGHENSLKDMPWLAIPYSQTELKTKLSRRFRIKSGVPTLVLLDRDGTTISVSAQEKLMEDPLGQEFPWRPRPLDQVLAEVVLQKGGNYIKEHKTTPTKDIRYSDLTDGVRGFYFSANWCPPCRAFTPQLAEVYQLIRKKEPNFEIIFISSDRSLDSYNGYIEGMPWLCVPFQQATVRAELAQLYGIRGIPTLLLLDCNGHIITMDGRSELIDDPMALNFPWKPRSVNILTERYITKLHDYPAIVLFVDDEETEIQFAENLLRPIANEYYKKNNINFNTYDINYLQNNNDDNTFLQFLICVDNTDTSDLIRDLVGLDLGDDDTIPLLLGIDIPNGHFAIMKYERELNKDNVQKFIEQFQKGNITFIDIVNAKKQTITGENC